MGNTPTEDQLSKSPRLFETENIPNICLLIENRKPPHALIDIVFLKNYLCISQENAPIAQVDRATDS